MMFALKKLRARRRPANQAHVTNRKENPALLAADAAEAAARGFAEVETTVGVARYAPLNAVAILVGSQMGRPGVITQCSVEERRNLQLGIQGLTTYSETLSVYGTERCFVDGDDTPWSKAFLASAYASRGIKVRFTSGAGAEALMGHAEGCSMLYLEARCLCAIRAAGSQGVQNGGISTVALAMAVPAGTREILAENLLAAWLDLEVASGNDAISSHSEIRKTAKLMGQFLPGTDFVTSGYSVMPRYDNMFGGGNYDADDVDDWLTLQRDWQVDGGIEPLAEEEALQIRERAARAIQAVFAELGFPAITDEEVALATTGYDSRDLPDRDRAADVLAGDRVLDERISGLDVALALDRAGYAEAAEAVLGMQRLRVGADYLQTSAIVGPSFEVDSAVNNPNEYGGPGTGYRLEGERWELLQRVPGELDSAVFAVEDGQGPRLVALGEAQPGGPADEVVLAVGPGVPGRYPGDDRRPAARGGDRCARGRRARRRRATSNRPRPAYLRRRIHRPRRRAPVGLPRGGRSAVERHRRHPPSRPPAPRQPRAVRNGAAADPRVLQGYRRQCGRLRARPAGEPGADRDRQLRPRQADRSHRAHARERDRGGRARRASARPRVGALRAAERAARPPSGAERPARPAATPDRRARKGSARASRRACTEPSGLGEASRPGGPSARGRCALTLANSPPGPQSPSWSAARPGPRPRCAP